MQGEIYLRRSHLGVSFDDDGGGGGGGGGNDYNNNNGYFERLTWMLTLSAYIFKHPSIDNKDLNAPPHTRTHARTRILRQWD